jgi:hypothetical protein
VNFSVQTDLVQLVPTPSALASSVAPTEAGQSPPAGFGQLLQMLSQPEAPTESALPDLMAVVASLAGSSEGIEKPAGFAEIAKDKTPQTTPKSPAELDPMAALQALLGMIPRIHAKSAPALNTEQTNTSREQTDIVLSVHAPVPDLELEIPRPGALPKPLLNLKDSDVRRLEFKTEAEIDPTAALQVLLGMAPQISPNLGPAPDTKEGSASEGQPGTALSAEAPVPDLEPEIPKLDALPKPLLNLKDFDVRRFEFKTELEIAAVQPKLIRISPLPGLLHGSMKPHPTELKPVKGSVDVVDSPPAAPSVFGGKHEAPLIEAPEAVQRVQVAIDPPPPPPVARQISMDIGDPESQVRVVIRERNGDLAVQFGAATERLRENLQNASPLLLHELQRDNTHSTISLDFSRFGTATEGGHESHQESRRKKALKSEAVFADVDETAYLNDDTSFAKSF